MQENTNQPQKPQKRFTNKQVIIGSIIIGAFLFLALFTSVAAIMGDSANDANTPSADELAKARAKEGLTPEEQAEIDEMWAELDAMEAEAEKAEAEKEQKIQRKDPIEGDPYEELNNLIGLDSVKRQVETLANFIRVQKEREAAGLKAPSISYHCVFTGNPGTGKTTVARILARIYKDLGVVSSGHLVETDRSGLIAEYVGQTAMKTNAVVDSALNGILFIDEAYALVQGGQDYGNEAIATLLKRMEDDRDRLVVIVAGYTDEMKEFIDANPGLQSRFNNYIGFPDYSAGELMQILHKSTDKYGYQMTPAAEKFVEQHLRNKVAHKDRNFGNARYVRNVFEKAIQEQANRISKDNKKHTVEELSTLDECDFRAAVAAR